MDSQRLILALGLAALVAGCREGGDAHPEAPPAAATRQAVVARVNDGDTLTLSGGAQVRLLQIDAPELLTECYGLAAANALRTLVPSGTRVQLVLDPRLDRIDRYGRLLRYVFVGRRNVNLALVRRGAASPYFFRNDRGRYAVELLDAVDAARAAGRGYWSACPGAELNPGVGSITGPR